MMKFFRRFKQLVKNSEKSTELLEQIRDGVANHTDVTNRKMNESIELLKQLVALQKMWLKQNNVNLSLNDFIDFQQPPSSFSEGDRPTFSAANKNPVARLPLLLAEKTYNTAHPDYDANLVRNFPGRIFNGEKATKNVVFQALPRTNKKKGLMEIKDQTWQPILDQMLQEVKEIPHSSQVFERKAYIEQYIDYLSDKYQAHYMPGWVNLEDALFLYWMVRILKPKTIVQTGVCNGLSSAFMMLGLVKNGPEGRLHVIDLPAVFDPNDPAWTVKDKVYGVLIPEGQTSGWMVPDAYRDRFEVQCGDAKELLPPLVDRLNQIDMFYHDSDHTYHHMMFEFAEAKRKLSPGGVIVGDDISWNESVWDFADLHHVPSYNYKGAVGVAFF